LAGSGCGGDHLLAIRRLDRSERLVAELVIRLERADLEGFRGDSDAHRKAHLEVVQDEVSDLG
jgi:hypothetical protein